MSFPLLVIVLIPAFAFLGCHSPVRGFLDDEEKVVYDAVEAVRRSDIGSFQMLVKRNSPACSLYCDNYSLSGVLGLRNSIENMNLGAWHIRSRKRDLSRAVDVVSLGETDEQVTTIVVRDVDIIVKGARDIKYRTLATVLMEGTFITKRLKDATRVREPNRPMDGTYVYINMDLQPGEWRILEIVHSR